MTATPTVWGGGWRRHISGAGALVRHAEGLRFLNPTEPGRTYANAQIDTYTGLGGTSLGRGSLREQPPLRLTVRARFSHPVHAMRGTAGFGFWNDPFMMSGTRRPALPAAYWFFLAGAPSNMALARGVPGCGWKAATIDVRRPLFYALAPSAPLAALLMRSRPLYQRLWPLAQRAMGVHEAQLDVNTTAWHVYTLVWEEQCVRFLVDGAPVLSTSQAPRGPLGCVIWLDNQYMIVRPTGVIRHGLSRRDEAQWMDISTVDLAPLNG